MERQFGRILVVAITCAASVLAGCAGGKEQEVSGTILEDDFSDPESGWPTADDDRVLLEYVDGGYRIVLRDPSRPHASWLFQVAEGEEALTVEADAALRGDPGGSDSGKAWGVACSSEGPDRRQTGVSYFFYVASDFWAIGREVPGSDAEEFIKRGEGGIERPARTHHLKAECVTHGDGRTTLAFAVDGRELTRTTDSEGPPHFTAIALHIRAEGANTEVFFDNVSVRRGEAP